MTIASVKRPDLERFIQDEIGAGRYDSADDLIEAALDQFRAGQDRPAADDEIDDAMADRLNRAFARIRAGDKGHTIEEARALLLKRWSK